MISTIATTAAFAAPTAAIAAASHRRHATSGAHSPDGTSTNPIRPPYEPGVTEIG
jgi:hypothetical protein